MPHDLLTLLKTHGPRLHGLLTRLTLRPDLAEELMQDLFLKLHRSAPFHHSRDPAAYAFRTAIHLALDARRHRPAPAALPESLPAAGPLPLDTLLNREAADHLLTALAALSPAAREAAVLHFIEQHSYDQTAAIMANTPHQVRGLCNDALRQLREKFHVAQEKSHE